jgi:chromosome segregation ATPase
MCSFAHETIRVSQLQSSLENAVDKLTSGAPAAELNQAKMLLEAAQGHILSLRVEVASLKQSLANARETISAVSSENTRLNELISTK